MENSTLGYGMFFVGCIFALLASFIVALNYRTLYENRQNKKRGIAKHISMIFLVPQILLTLSGTIFQNFPIYPVSGWLLLAIALSDPGIWLIVALPVAMRFRK